MEKTKNLDARSTITMTLVVEVYDINIENTKSAVVRQLGARTGSVIKSIDFKVEPVE